VQPTRYEIKMTCDDLYLADVRAWIRLHPASFIEAYPPRRVNSLYFDTIEGNCLDANLLGVGERRKLRLRWYGEDCTSITGTLELKCKTNQLGWKEYFPLQETFDFASVSWTEFIHRLHKQVDGKFALWLSYANQPTLIISYVREYYESIDHQVRVTIDYDLRAYEQLMFVAPNLTCAAPARDCVVVEVKSNIQLYRRVSDILSSFHLQIGRNSKYVNGVMGSVGLL
jgi:hypothetical protein